MLAATAALVALAPGLSIASRACAPQHASLQWRRARAHVCARAGGDGPVAAREEQQPAAATARRCGRLAAPLTHAA